ncbi:TPA: hypothetical protein ACKQBZ_000245 [Stenotrophomonas maltophilia]
MKKFLVRNRYFLIGVAIGTAFGIAFTMVILEAPEYGSKADWAAAFGTWAIGAAATYLAVDARKQSVSAEISRRFTRQSQFLFSLAHANLLETEADSFLDEEADQRMWTDYYELLDTLDAYAREVPMTSDLAEHLPQDVVGEMIIVNELLRMARRDLQNEKRRVSRTVAQEGVVGEQELSNLKFMRSLFSKIATRNKKVVEMVKSQMA